MTGSAAKRVAIVQSNYIPWKGYFDLINLVDEFLLYDDRQYTRRDWRNRNRVKTPHGPVWLTIPVQVKGRYHQRIDETAIADPEWGRAHWRTITQNYAEAPFFDLYRDRVAHLYATDEELLSRVNRTFIEEICAILGIHTRISWSTDYEGAGAKTERLVSLCVQSGAGLYLSGPAAKEYMEEERFAAAGIALEYMDYAGYPEYPQLNPPFDPHVSVLDLLFNVGPDAPRYLKSFGA
ncbi:MAG: WbqC family protein [Gaiellaceae bacterium]